MIPTFAGRVVSCIGFDPKSGHDFGRWFPIRDGNVPWYPNGARILVPFLDDLLRTVTAREVPEEIRGPIRNPAPTGSGD